MEIQWRGGVVGSLYGMKQYRNLRQMALSSSELSPQSSSSSHFHLIEMHFPFLQGNVPPAQEVLSEKPISYH